MLIPACHRLNHRGWCAECVAGLASAVLPAKATLTTLARTAHWGGDDHDAATLRAALAQESLSLEQQRARCAWLQRQCTLLHRVPPLQRPWSLLVVLTRRPHRATGGSMARAAVQQSGRRCARGERRAPRRDAAHHAPGNRHNHRATITLLTRYSFRVNIRGMHPCATTARHLITFITDCNPSQSPQMP